jgi:hypothetical protein
MSTQSIICRENCSKLSFDVKLAMVLGFGSLTKVNNQYVFTASEPIRHLLPDSVVISFSLKKLINKVFYYYEQKINTFKRIG